jgi:hypothetical protein
MGRVTVALVGVGVLGASLLAPGSADAGCVDILKEWQRRVPDRVSSNAVDREVERANAALKRGNESACRAHMRNAQAMLRNPPAYGQRRDDWGWRDSREYPPTRWGYGDPSYQPGWGFPHRGYEYDRYRWGAPPSWGREYDGR